MIEIGNLIHDTSRMRRRLFDMHLAAGVSRAQWWTLRHLRDHFHDPPSQLELAISMDINRVTLGHLVHALEMNRLLRRASDSVDRRLKRLVITRTGTRFLQRVERLGCEFEDHILAGISQADRMAVGAALRQMKQNLLVLGAGAESKMGLPAYLAKRSQVRIL